METKRWPPNRSDHRCSRLSATCVLPAARICASPDRDPSVPIVEVSRFELQGMITGTSPSRACILKQGASPGKEFLVMGCDDAHLRPLFRNTSTFWRMTGLCCQHTTSPTLGGGGGGFGAQDSNVHLFLSSCCQAWMVTFIPAWF